MYARVSGTMRRARITSKPFVHLLLIYRIKYLCYDTYSSVAICQNSRLHVGCCFVDEHYRNHAINDDVHAPCVFGHRLFQLRNYLNRIKLKEYFFTHTFSISHLTITSLLCCTVLGQVSHCCNENQ